MPTINVRFEISHTKANQGSIYYRIYKGHNRRIEFSSRIHIPIEYWDAENRCVRHTHPQAQEFNAKIKADVNLLQQIIQNDTAQNLTMQDIVDAFKLKKAREAANRQKAVIQKLRESARSAGD